jgi:hypothetical protein
MAAFLRWQPVREICISRQPLQRFFAASDAANEEGLQPSGGFLLVFDELRLAGVAALATDALPVLNDGTQKIAQYELIQV